MSGETPEGYRQGMIATGGSTISNSTQTIVEHADQVTINPPPALRVPFQAPPLPAHFVARPDVMQVLKERILTLDPSTPGILEITAIQGMGGIGKSTMAAALACEPDVQAHFLDGVLWATLGQNPDLLALLSGWIRALGDYHTPQPTNAQTATTHLCTLLHDKAALLVVDDAWNPEHVEPFRVGGSHSRLLITTREASLAGAEYLPLAVMTQEQAVTILSHHLPRPLTESQQKEVMEVAEAVGYLPLALELAAAQAADGLPMLELLGDLRAEVARLESLERPGAEDVPEGEGRKQWSLLASLNLSLARLSEDNRRHFAWLGVLYEDSILTPAVVSTLWDMTERQARDVLRLLARKAMLLPGTTLADATPTYRLQDLVRDLAWNTLVMPQQENTSPARATLGYGILPAQAHAQLLEGYRRRTQGGNWPMLEADGYIHDHLLWHMAKAGQSGGILDLLCQGTLEGRNAWYVARERLGQTTGYVQDLTFALRLAQAQSHEAVANNRPVITLVLEAQLTFMLASINSLAIHVPFSLLSTLVQEGLWTGLQGLTYARLNASSPAKASGLVAVAPYLPEPLQAQVLDEALETAKATKDAFNRVWTLAEVAPHLPEPQRTQVLDEALETANAMEHNSGRSQVLAELASHLPEPQRTQVLDEALETANAIDSNSGRSQALVAVARHLPEPLRTQIAEQTLEAAKASQDVSFRAWALGAVAPLLPEPQRTQVLEQALEAAKAMEHNSFRFSVLAELAKNMAEAELGQQALETASTIKETLSRAWALAAVAPHLPEPQRAQVLEQALETSRTIGDVSFRSRALAELARNMAETELEQQALETAKAIENRAWRTSALVAVAPRLREPQRTQVLDEALETARAIEDVTLRCQALAAVAPLLPEPQRAQVLEQALEEAKAIEDVDALLQAKNVAFLQETILAAPGVESLPDAFLYASWSKLTERLITCMRTACFPEVCNQLPLIVSLGGREALPDLAHSIRAVYRWWP